MTSKKMITEEINKTTEVIRVIEDRAEELEVDVSNDKILLALRGYKKGLVFARDLLFTKEDNA